MHVLVCIDTTCICGIYTYTYSGVPTVRICKFDLVALRMEKYYFQKRHVALSFFLQLEYYIYYISYLFVLFVTFSETIYIYIY